MYPILIIGSGNDVTFAHTRRMLVKGKIPFKEIILERFYNSTAWSIDYAHNIVSFGKVQFRFDDYHSIYHRLIADENLFGPSVHEMPLKYISLICILNALAEKNHPEGKNHPAQRKHLIVNNPSFEDVNSSKIQQLIQTSPLFPVPVSLCTASPRLAKNFIAAEQRIYKSCSSVRSIVKAVKPSQLHSIHLLQHCPCLFQQQIPGDDVRIHVIMNDCYSEKISSDKVDYRYAQNNVHTYDHKIPTVIKRSLLTYMRENELYFVGADFKVDQNNAWYLLEINTMPGYSGYDQRCGLAISRRLLRLLTTGK